MEQNETTVNTNQQYIIPVKMLCAIAVSCPEDGIDAAVKAKVQKLVESEEAKAMLFDLSRNYSDIMEEGAFVVVPGLVAPVNDSQDADVIIDFVKRLNESTANIQGEQNESSADD